MLKDQIVVGRSYVNEDAGIMREVVEDVDGRRVKLNTFYLATGKLVPTRHKVWHKSELARWADREASPSESAQVHPYESAAWQDIPSWRDAQGNPPENARVTRDELPGHINYTIGK